MKNILLLLFIILFNSCNIFNEGKSAQKLWDEGQKYRIEEDLKESINRYKAIINSYPNHELAPKAQFQIADIYLNDTKDYEYAIKEFKVVYTKYPDYNVAKKSLFMIAYIYNNYINAYTDAIEYYDIFRNKYPDDELMPSVEYELNGLLKINNDIDSLRLLRKEK